MTITDEAIEHLKGWLGKPRRERGWNSAVTEDAIWHFAQGVGDDNPLWWDASYAETTRWGRMFAPPTFLYSCSNAGLRVGENGIYPAQDWMPGTLPLWLSDRWVFHRPAYEGESVTATAELVSLEERPGRDGSRSVSYTDRTTYSGPDGTMMAERFQLMLRRARPSGETPLPSPLPDVHYSDDERRAVEEHYEGERAQRRGNRTLHASEVRVGDAMPELVKGPLTVTNIVGWLLGWGSPLCQTNRIAYRYLKEHPRAALEDPRSNIQDTIEGVHWEPYLAQRSGMPGRYDFGPQRVSWVAHLLTDWFGDDGFLAEMEVRVRRPNFVGDTTWLRGEVTGIVDEANFALVDTSISGVNQRGEETTTAAAKVRLPR